MSEESIVVLGQPPERLMSRLQDAASGASLVVGSSMDDLEPHASSATIVLAWGASREWLSSVLRASPGVRWVHIMSAGINHLVSPELTQTEAVVTNGRGLFSSSLGEWVVGAILYFAKDFRRLIHSQSQGVWEPFDVVEVAGQTVGIVGYGDIGREVAIRARGLGMKVLGLSRRGPAVPGGGDDLAEEMFGPDGLVEMIRQSDYVVVTAPLTPDTRGLIGEAEIAAMKPDAVIINIGRGPVIEEDALKRALAEKWIKGAALDVFHREPLPADDPLYSMENVLLSPHCADHTAVWLDDAMELFLENLARYRAGEALRNELDKSRGY